jgi:unsaturated pyranuronate lyase
LEASKYFSTQSAQQPTEAGRFLNIDGVARVHMSEGLEFRPILGQGMLFSFVSFAPHVEAPRHTHSEEQVVIVLAGEIEFDLDGDVRILREGDVVVIPPWVPHGAHTRESGCRELDVFCPPRRALLDLLAAADTASPKSRS